MKVQLYRSKLTYRDLTVHTASSGPVDVLDTIHLVLDYGGHQAVGEMRINCHYLNGFDASYLLEHACDCAGALDWNSRPEELRAFIAASALPAPVRMLFDIALWDLSAKRVGLPLAHLLVGKVRELRHVSNQTLFLSANKDFDERVESYVARGFRDLKLRVGRDITEDCARHARLRAMYGTTVNLSADVNGAWSAQEAPARLSALAAFGLDYIEQPIAAGNWEALTQLAKVAPLPVMLDESLSTARDVQEVISRRDAAGGRFQAHLKLIKLGGVTPALAAARALGAAGIPFMIGQMNEGAVATAAALHLAVATMPLHAELYGADGLINDPAEGLAYADGQVFVRENAGLGVSFRALSAPIFERK